MGDSPPDTPNPFLGEWPPQGTADSETPAQKTVRQTRELEAARINASIDEDIRQHRIQLKKDKDVIRVLLLGQAESGKSTTLKNFLMRYATDAWQKERNGWRAVVQLNVVRSIITILTAVEADMNGESPPDDDDDDEHPGEDETSTEPARFAEHHQLLMIRLAPLRGVETDLRRRLGAGSEPLQPMLSTLAVTPFDSPSSNPNMRKTPSEFSVRSWNEVLDPSSHGGIVPPNSGLESATLTIASCKDDMKSLWEDKNVRLSLRRRKIRLPDSAGFFLNELDRVAHRDYQITDDDIVRARLRTVGIQEHRVKFKRGPWDAPLSKSSSKETSSDSNSHGWEWRIYDVGGCRTSRQAWLPFFEDATCIIFLCPVSVFDERLEEDPRVNRLEDSILLWKSICSSKLLAKAQLVLFLNKCDLLKRKLKRGVKVNKYLTSYKDKNEVFPVVKYLQGKFKEIQKSLSPEPRTSYIFPTTVTDTRATAKTLETVRDGLLRANLTTSQLI